MKMVICEWCEKKFDYDEAAEKFNDKFFPYRNCAEVFCPECFEKVLAGRISNEDLFTARCSVCNNEFDCLYEKNLFERISNGEASFDPGELTDYWNDGYICYECAWKKYLTGRMTDESIPAEHRTDIMTLEKYFLKDWTILGKRPYDERR